MMGEAVLVIDMLNDFVREDGALQCGTTVRKIVEPIAKRVKQARQYGETVIYMCDSHMPHDPEFEQFPPHAVRGTEGAQVIDELKPRDGDYVLPKRRYSAFFQSELLLALLECNVTDIEITGVCTNICVMYTAADAISYGFHVTVFPERVAALDEQSHEIGLQQMEEVLGVEVKR
ncbi:MAG: cysteine hydrolase [candidate division WS1 bacterium]|jgi:nicotinamidase-related amidase|nr:cysteine hydrolase [candidate division WS1 bacterium]